MPKTINLYEAKTSFSRLVEEAAAGEEIVICKAGKPKARLVPVKPERRAPRKLGLWKGRIWISEDFDEPLPDDLLDLFYEGHPDDPLRQKPKDDESSSG
jgi:prevent-host-death family protein